MDDRKPDTVHRSSTPLTPAWPAEIHHRLPIKSYCNRLFSRKLGLVSPAPPIAHFISIRLQLAIRWYDPFPVFGPL